jgi:tRNA threonylcarbamoyladenosine biosynthesis protein TsaE
VNASLLATVRTDSPEATRGVGRRLAPLLEPGDIVLIEGDLGAGKTTFVQGLAAGLGVTGPVASPTFTLMRVLDCAQGGAVKRLLHADLYRLDHLQEVVDLGLMELVDDDAVAAVEWGDAGAAVFGKEVLEVLIEPGSADCDGDNERSITISGTDSWLARAGAVSAVFGRAA